MLKKLLFTLSLVASSFAISQQADATWVVEDMTPVEQRAFRATVRAEVRDRLQGIERRHNAQLERARLPVRLFAQALGIGVRPLKALMTSIANAPAREEMIDRLGGYIYVATQNFVPVPVHSHLSKHWKKYALGVSVAALATAYAIYSGKADPIVDMVCESRVLDATSEVMGKATQVCMDKLGDAAACSTRNIGDLLSGVYTAAFDKGTALASDVCETRLGEMSATCMDYCTHAFSSIGSFVAESVTDVCEAVCSSTPTDALTALTPDCSELKVQAVERMANASTPMLFKPIAWAWSFISA